MLSCDDEVHAKPLAICSGTGRSHVTVDRQKSAVRLLRILLR
jgi:hypothetical protein